MLLVVIVIHEIIYRVLSIKFIFMMIFTNSKIFYIILLKLSTAFEIIIWQYIFLLLVFLPIKYLNSPLANYLPFTSLCIMSCLWYIARQHFKILLLYVRFYQNFILPTIFWKVISHCEHVFYILCCNQITN